MLPAPDGSVTKFTDIEESDDSLKSQELGADSTDENGLLDIEVKQPPS